MRILIFGAGVIGSLYGAMLAEAGYDVSIYARGRRLECLTQVGLLYKRKGKIQKALPNGPESRSRSASHLKIVRNRCGV